MYTSLIARDKFKIPEEVGTDHMVGHVIVCFTVAASLSLVLFFFQSDQKFFFFKYIFNRVFLFSWPLRIGFASQSIAT